GESENVLGEIRVVAGLALRIQQLVLVVTEGRILVAHVGKRGAGARAPCALAGRLSGGFEDIVKGGGESRSKRALQRLTPERILTANKDNFPLRFGEIVGVRLVERPYSG